MTEFVTKYQVRTFFEGKTVAVVGSGPGVLSNNPGFVDSHDVVVRVNNYRLSIPTGWRTDCHYSFYGTSIRKTREELITDGVKLCICKCPDAKPIVSAWHERNGKLNGVDFRSIYKKRADWWFCPVYIPTTDNFMVKFILLNYHMPTTGFAAILDVLGFNPKSVYLTGFDFFRSAIHNVNQPWREKNLDDPIGHVPEAELLWLAQNLPSLPVTCDPDLTKVIESTAWLEAWA